MPWVFDGYNLLHAFRKLSDEFSDLKAIPMCGYIAEDMRRMKDTAIIVFDGFQLVEHKKYAQPEGPIVIIYSGAKREADDVIEDKITESFSPKRLVIVSSDNRIRQAARRRRSQSIKAIDYISDMVNRLSKPEQKRREPEVKFTGLSKEEGKEWMTIFGLNEDDQRDQSSPTSNPKDIETKNKENYGDCGLDFDIDDL